nr:uncharacterized protein LOC129532780 isoform X1 [Gorilla gorilla gorilla]
MVPGLGECPHGGLLPPRPVQVSWAVPLLAEEGLGRDQHRGTASSGQLYRPRVLFLKVKQSMGPQAGSHALGHLKLCPARGFMATGSCVHRKKRRLVLPPWPGRLINMLPKWPRFLQLQSLTERTKWKRRCGSQFLGVDLKKLTTSMSYLLGCSCSQPLCCEEDHVVTRRGRMPGSCSQPSLAHEWAILGWPNSHHARRAGGSSTGPCPTCRFRIKQ